MNNLLARNAAFITDRRSFALFIALTLLALAFIRAFLFPGVGGDDGEQLVFSQFWSWGYQVRNPPMVTWMLIALQEVTGATIFSIVLLRTLILLGIYYLSYKIGEHLFKDQRLATLSAGSLLMIFYMGWNTIHGFTHTSLVTLFYCATLLAVLKIRNTPSPLMLVVLGALISLGLIAKYSYLVFAFALIAATMCDRNLRRNLISPWIALGILIPLPIVVPQIQWLLANAPAGHLIDADTSYTALDIFGQKIKGLLRLVPATLGFLMPFGVVAAIIFWKTLRHRPERLTETQADLKLFERTFVFLIASAAVAIMLIQSDRLRSHYFFVLVPLVPYFFLRLGHAFTDRQIKLLAAAISLAGICLISALVTKYFVEPKRCGHCEDHIPYDDFADQLRQKGFRSGTIFAYFHKDPLAGNFRVRFPKSRIVSAKHPNVIPPKQGKSGQCVIIWPVVGSVEPKSATIRTANESPLATNITYDHPSVVMTSTLPPHHDKQHQLEFILIDEGNGNCR